MQDSAYRGVLVFKKDKHKMNRKQEFYQDMANCQEPFTHITEVPCDDTLQKIDELFGAADVLSIRNAKKYRLILLALAFVGTLVTFLFLLYDEANLHMLVLACVGMILCLFLIGRIANRIDCHKKYLEYRVLAESLRVQYFLYSLGVKVNISELLPWTLKQCVPWIREILKELPVSNAVQEDATSVEESLEAEEAILAKKTLSGFEQVSALDGWIRAQRAYHEKALRKTRKQDRVSSRVSRIVLIITIVSYIGAVIFELFLCQKVGGETNAELIRSIMKIILGTLSATTLFTGSYYGKMSLSNVIDDHQRMIALYDQTEQEILQKGETEEILLSLAQECLNENSTWYAYQSKNTPDINLG